MAQTKTAVLRRSALLRLKITEHGRKTGLFVIVTDTCTWVLKRLFSKMDSERRWEIYLATLSPSSRQQYTVAVSDFKNWCHGSTKEPISAETVVEYIKYLHDVRQLKTKTIWSLNSMVGSYYEAYKGSKPHDDLPLINKVLKQWEKSDTVKKASTFESEEIFKYLKEAPDDDFHLVRKVAMILALNGLERKNEITWTTIDELKFNVDCILVTFDRLKSSGESKKSQFMITDSLMRSIVSKYYNLFSEEQKCSKERFFRKMIKGRITQGVIGENMIAKIGEDVARWLGYSPEDAKKYTSHCFRRSAATMLVESGVSHNVLKIAGGWRSDKACEGYINDSSKMKRSIADLLANETSMQVSENSSSVSIQSNSVGSALAAIENRSETIRNQHYGNVFNISNISNCQFHISLSTAPKDNGIEKAATVESRPEIVQPVAEIIEPTIQPEPEIIHPEPRDAIVMPATRSRRLKIAKK